MSLSLTGFLPGRSLTARLDLAAAAFAIALGSAVFAAVLWVPAVLADPDTLWRITVGQWILANLAVPSTDIYSFTAQGRPWVAHEWLSEVVLTLAYRARVSGYHSPGMDRHPSSSSCSPSAASSTGLTMCPSWPSTS